jgi:chromosome partitioning protein
MAHIIGLVNQKGGVGKTTTSISLGAYLAAMGKYVLLVDLDPQANATSGMGLQIGSDHLSIYHAMVHDHNPDTLIRKTSVFGCNVLPSSESLAGANVDLVGMEGREFKLKEALNKVRAGYDYILIDCPPSLGLLTINGLAAAEQLVIPVQCEYFALEGLSQLFRTINLVIQGINPDLKILGVLLTMYDKRNRLAREVLKEVQRNFPGYVFDAVVPRSVSLAEAPSFAKPILQYDPGSKGANAYRQLAQEVINLAEQK